MMTHPTLEKIWRGPRGMRAGIKACEKAKCVVSALTLIYSTVDAMAALTRDSSETRATRQEFLRWVTDYLIPEFDVGLTAEDLYGARCGVVHTYGPVSDLSRAGRAKLLVYKWRTGQRPDDPVLEEKARYATVVEIEALIEGLDKAVRRFEHDVSVDQQLHERVERNVVDLLCYEPWTPVSVTVAA